jgi:hypothetical protein
MGLRIGATAIVLRQRKVQSSSGLATLGQGSRPTEIAVYEVRIFWRVKGMPELGVSLLRAVSRGCDDVSALIKRTCLPII